MADDWERFPQAIPALRERLAADPASDARWGTYLFLLGEPRTLVGWGGFKGPPTAGEVELGYSVAPAYEGRGLATAAVEELLRLAAGSDVVTAVTAHTLSEPGPSPRVLEKAGFVRDGAPTVQGGRAVWGWRRRLGR